MSTPIKQNSDFLENERSIPLHPSLAHTFGVPQAIILQQIRFWMKTYSSADNKRHFHDGRWWVYNTYEQWQKDNFGFWSKRTIQRHINDLEKQGVLLSDEFNKDTGDRTKWYTIDFDAMDRLVETKLKELTPSSQSVQMGISSKCPDHLDKMTRPSSQSGTLYNKESEITTETTDPETIDQKQKTIAPSAQSSEPLPPDSDPEKPPRKLTDHQLMFQAICDALTIDTAYLTPDRESTIGKTASAIRKGKGIPKQIPGFMRWLKEKAKEENWSGGITEHAMRKYWPDYATAIAPKPPQVMRAIGAAADLGEQHARTMAYYASGALDDAIREIVGTQDQTVSVEEEAA
jgi:hypothetical protein